MCNLSLALASDFWNEIGYVLFFSLLEDLKIDISSLHVWVEFNRKSVVLANVLVIFLLLSQHSTKPMHIFSSHSTLGW